MLLKTWHRIQKIVLLVCTWPWGCELERNSPHNIGIMKSKKSRSKIWIEGHFRENHSQVQERVLISYKEEH